MNLARSPKFHRPRGPSCLRGGCDGCVLRVDGVPNVLTCLEPVRDGARVESQNSALTRRFDPLRGADFTFPNGFNHHDFLAGIPIAEDLLAAFARKVAGLGHLSLGNIDTTLLGGLLTGSIPGVLLGSWLSHRLDGAWVARGIAVLLLISGGKLLAI